METHVVSLQRMGYSLAEAEVMANVSRSTLYRAIDAARLRVVKAGKRSIIPADSLAAFCGLESTAAQQLKPQARLISYCQSNPSDG
jgi:uncharacterized protein YaiE (UPF0345 family)